MQFIFFSILVSSLFMVPRAMENLKLWVLELGVDSWWEGCEPVAVLWIHRVSEPFVLGSFLNVLGIVWEFVPAFDRHKLYLYPGVLAWPRLCRFQPQFCRHAFPACL